MPDQPESSSTTTSGDFSTGQLVEVTIERMAHGGEGIGVLPDGKIIFIAGAFPGDTITAKISKSKKNFCFGDLVEVLTSSELRVENTCPAAAQGAGCCDFAELAPSAEAELKKTILLDQLNRVARLKGAPKVAVQQLSPRHWRTRVRLGVDETGHAGLRRRGSHELVTSVACTQLVEGLVDGIVGPDARTFTPGAELIVVRDASSNRHVVESVKAARGRRVEKIESVVEGTGTVTEKIGEFSFSFPATAFWQGHKEAPSTYSQLIRDYLAPSARGTQGTAWDLYGGVGAFIPAIAQGLSAGPQISTRVYSVDYSPAATAMEQADLQEFEIYTVADRVEKVAAQLPQPNAVVLDPPRVGAGRDVINTVAAARPEVVVHIGCDPATFARDIGYWTENGYRLDHATLVNAFPGTHHFEVVARLVPINSQA
ncbi:MAG: TRAM domain-containing protein [Corynebacterium sp.]|nr:TRAM domain-containing protein [Corynebacterium sp.]